MSELNSKKKAIIFGAGPAGLTSAYELLDKTTIKPVVYEKSSDIGGLSKTVNYKGNRIDIGGHRFFSKSSKIMEWWCNILPLQGSLTREDIILKRDVPVSHESKYRKIKDTKIVIKSPPDPEKEDRVMLYRNRISRILFLRKFYDYPVSITLQTIKNLGFRKILKIIWSYSLVKIFPKKELKSLEDFFISRFGNELYRAFFKDYTEKVWGVSCRVINANWGIQRVKGLSVSKSITHAIKNRFMKTNTISQKNTETSLIGRFLYPKFGPGQMWETVAEIISTEGGIIKINHEITNILLEGNRVKSVKIRDNTSGKITEEKADYFFSSMPIKDLINRIEPSPDENIKNIASNLVYRDFIIAGILLSELKVKNTTKIRTVNNIIPDNWIYIQEKDVHLGRIQVFNNWSPYMAAHENTIWLGAEYFCTEGDELWSLPDNDFLQLAMKELEKIDFIDTNSVKDGCVIRVPKAYPSYIGSYERISEVIAYLNTIENLFLIGRNGMHRYNNQDHSMMSAMAAVDNVMKGITRKDNLWKINVEEEYHEEIHNEECRRL
jgi:protoporphyrinogen oxidase